VLAVPRQKHAMRIDEPSDRKRPVEPQDLPRGGVEPVRNDDPAGVVDGHESAVEGGVELGGKEQAIEHVQPFGVGVAVRPGLDVTRAQ